MKYLLALVSIVLIGVGVYFATSDKNTTPQPTTQEVGMTESQSDSQPDTSPQPPVAKKLAHEMTIHGDTRVDHYYWMRDDSRTDPEILAHLEAENTYKETMLADTKSLQEKLYNEMVSRLEKDKSTVP